MAARIRFMISVLQLLHRNTPLLFLQYAPGMGDGFPATSGLHQALMSVLESPALDDNTLFCQ